MMQLFLKGGVLMYPIFICSVLALAIFCERFFAYARLARTFKPLVREVESLVSNQRVDEALAVCERADSPLARIYATALRASGKSREHLKVLVEEIGTREAAPLERYLCLMATIATIAPLLGLLGTVLGMIKAFNVIAIAGVGTPATLGGGISEALITTATGLAVAIPTILLHRYLTSRADNLALEMEEQSLHLVNLLGD
jgi:biopolymer transport protein ExbB